MRRLRANSPLFFEVFPNVTVWANLRQGAGYDMVLMGQMEPLEVNLDEVLQRLDRPDYAAVRQSLRNVDFNSAFDMLATYIGSAADLKPWIQGAQINTDGNLRLSYLAGWGINSEIADNLYHQTLAYRHLPVTIFSGSTEHLKTFLAELQSPPVAVDDSEDPD